MSRHVNWPDSPIGGSHRRNDSGVGPFSDSDDRSRKSSNEYDDPYSVTRLQERLLEVTKQKEKYKKKAEELDLDLMRVKLDLAQTKKDLGEKEAQWRALKDSNEVLASDKQGLLEQTKQQQDEIARLEDKLRRVHRKSGSPPTSMSGAIPPETDDKTPRRTTSQRKAPGRRGSISQKDYDRDRALRHQLRAEEEERQRQEKEQEERLRRRMGNNPGDESDANNSKSSRGSKTSKGSHTSYIEPLGPKEPRPQVPHSPRESRPPAAQYPAYATTQYAQPTFTTMAREPVSSNITRSIRPQVFYSEGGDDYQQPGSYKPYPLPREGRR